ncbi:MAG: hydantoinase/oxoprolinase family protein [Burkholderiaceae bacterium]
MRCSSASSPNAEVITTAGFRDVLSTCAVATGRPPGACGASSPRCRADRRLESAERTLADGTVRTPVDEAELRAAARQLRRGLRIAVYLLHQQLRQPGQRGGGVGLPGAGLAQCAHHGLAPDPAQCANSSGPRAASLNAARNRWSGRYVGRLEAALAEQGSPASLLIVQSNGGLMSVDSTRRFPVRTALSGPAAGSSPVRTSRRRPAANVITGDVGGTSFDVSLISAGRIAQAAQQAIGFGMVIRTPMIEIQTIGAGGGSIAAVDASGLLRMGPESAGSNPGPVCYGLRGADDELGPTVTDANVVLGRINAARPIGALTALDVAAARAAIDAHVGQALGLSTEQAAEAMLTVANANMAGAIRLVSIERGHDPGQFAYMPFGGGGALHVCAMMREVGVATGLVPRYPGVSSALGCAIADMRHDFVQTLNQPLARLDGAALQQRIHALQADGRAALATAGISFEGERTLVELDMLYQGQTHTVATPLDETDWAGDAAALPAGIHRAFEAAYRLAFGKALVNVPIRVLNLRLAVIGLRRKFDLQLLAPVPGLAAAQPREHRQVHHLDTWHETPVYERLQMPVGTTVRGPAMFEQSDTTIWLEPGFMASVDALGNLLVTPEPATADGHP